MNDSKMPTGPVPAGWQNLEEAEDKLKELFRGMVEHNGISKLQIDVTPLKKGKKNVVFSSGKDYHFVLKPFGDAQGKPVQKTVQKPVEDGPPEPRPNGCSSGRGPIGRAGNPGD